MPPLIDLMNWQELGSALFKISLALLAFFFLDLALKPLDPRWRVKLARIVLISLPILLVAHFWKPVWQVSSEALPTSIHPLIPQTIPDAAEKSSLLQTIAIVWISGIAISLIRGVYSLSILTRLAHQARAASPELRQIWEKISADFNLGPTEICVLDQEHTPFVSPLHKSPRVVVPASFDRDSKLHNLDPMHALRHEAAHLKSSDHWWIMWMKLGCSLLWFHPFAWGLVAMHLRACEEACDAEAARLGGLTGYRQSLAQLALTLIPSQSSFTASFLRVPSVTSRLAQLRKTISMRPPRFWSVAPALASWLILISCLGLFQLIAKANSSNDNTSSSNAPQVTPEFTVEVTDYEIHVLGGLKNQTNPTALSPGFSIQIDPSLASGKPPKHQSPSSTSDLNKAALAKLGIDEQTLRKIAEKQLRAHLAERAAQKNKE